MQSNRCEDPSTPGFALRNIFTQPLDEILQSPRAKAMQSGDHPGKMKDAVCSPGGSTIQGVRALEKGGFRSAITEAIIATWEKNKEFAK